MKTTIESFVTKQDANLLRTLFQRPDLEAARRGGAMNPLIDALREARVVDTVPATQVRLGSTVRYIDERTGSTNLVTLTLPKDANTAPQHISVLSPVATALLGRAAGERIEVSLPGDRTTALRIVEVAQEEVLTEA